MRYSMYMYYLKTKLMFWNDLLHPFRKTKPMFIRYGTVHTTARVLFALITVDTVRTDLMPITEAMGSATCGPFAKNEKRSLLVARPLSW